MFLVVVVLLRKGVFITNRQGQFQSREELLLATHHHYLSHSYV
jgi:hypothetical protein